MTIPVIVAERTPSAVASSPSVSGPRKTTTERANPNGRGEGGFTALHGAAQNEDEELARLLLERGADPSLAADGGRKPADFGLADLLS